MDAGTSEDRTTLLSDISSKTRLRGRFQDLMRGDHELRSKDTLPYISRKVKGDTNENTGAIPVENTSHVNKGYASDTSQKASPIKSAPSSLSTAAPSFNDSTEPPYQSTFAENLQPVEEKLRKGTKKLSRRKRHEQSAITEHKEQNSDSIKVPESSSNSPSSSSKKSSGTKRSAKLSSKHLEIESGSNDVDEQNRASNIFGIIIHEASKIKSNIFITHPVVQVHVINLETGTYLRKRDIEQSVSSYYENRHGNVDHVMPVMTQPCNYFPPRITNLVWEELIMFNEDFNYFIAENPRTILFFEILDFVSLSMNSLLQHPKPEDGWYRVAWAFLVIRSSKGVLHTSKKLKLQLFRPVTHRFSPDTSATELFKWWKSGIRTRIEGTMTVTVKPLTPPENVEPSTRSLLPMQQECSADLLDNSMAPKLGTHKSGSSFQGTSNQLSDSLTAWSRFPGQTCKVPADCVLSFSTNKGCFTAQFSHSGRSVACGVNGTDTYEITLYQVPSGSTICNLRNHGGLIYDLDWADDDSLLLSSSADCTARLWSVSSATCVAAMPHPCFVYCAKFHPLTSTLIVTGSFDKLLRVWYVTLGKEVSCELLQELNGHTAHINDICWDHQSSRLFSADNVGCVLVWNSCQEQRKFRKGTVMPLDWQLEKEICLQEIKGIPINSIRIHPSGRKILIHCRDSLLRLVDINSEVVIRQYVGIVNFQYLLRSCFSPCGSLIASGSEDGTAYVWYTDTGQKAKIYTDLPYKGPVTCVRYHPHDNMMVMCAEKPKSPILIFGCSKKDVSFEASSQSPSETMPSHASESAYLNRSMPRKQRNLEERNQTDVRRQDTAESSTSFNAAVEKTIRLQRIAARLDSVLHAEKKRSVAAVI